MKIRNITILTALLIGSIAQNSFASHPGEGGAYALCVVFGTIGSIGAFKTAKFVMPYAAQWGARNGETIGKVIGATCGGVGGFIGTIALCFLIPEAIEQASDSIKNLKNKLIGPVNDKQ